MQRNIRVHKQIYVTFVCRSTQSRANWSQREQAQSNQLKKLAAEWNERSRNTLSRTKLAAVVSKRELAESLQRMLQLKRELAERLRHTTLATDESPRPPEHETQEAAESDDNVIGDTSAEEDEDLVPARVRWASSFLSLLLQLV